MIRCQINYVRSPEATAREFQQLVREANGYTVQFWHDEFAPEHFTPEAEDKYGYQPRKGENEPEFIPRRHGIGTRKNPAYFWRKKHEGFGTTPLVRTGTSERASANFKVTASLEHGKGVFISLPSYFYKYLPGAPDKAAELTTVTDDEVQDLAKHHEQFITAKLEAANERSQVTI